MSSFFELLPMAFQAWVTMSVESEKKWVKKFYACAGTNACYSTSMHVLTHTDTLLRLFAVAYAVPVNISTR